jgi:NAD(P)-dependent dehydrogenase (short-subunit alcohol dehydrogenase family)
MKNIIVTGGSRGIGAAIVRRFAKEGNRVILNYNKSEIEAEKIKQEFPENPEKETSAESFENNESFS